MNAAKSLKSYQMLTNHWNAIKYFKKTTVEKQQKMMKTNWNSLKMMPNLKNKNIQSNLQVKQHGHKSLTWIKKYKLYVILKKQMLLRIKQNVVKMLKSKQTLPNH